MLAVCCFKYSCRGDKSNSKKRFPTFVACQVKVNLHFAVHNQSSEQLLYLGYTDCFCRGGIIILKWLIEVLATDFFFFYINALILIIVSTLMDTKWMGHCIWYALDHFSWTKISMCSMSLTRQMQCNITCLYFAARGSVQYMHLTTAHILAKSSIGIVIKIYIYI